MSVTLAQASNIVDGTLKKARELKQMPQTVIQAAQDRGVAVYDGRRWTTYDTRNSGLSFDDVNGIAFDSRGRAWLATPDTT